MTGRNGQALLSTWVPAELASAFKAYARTIDGGTAAALRRLVTGAVGNTAPVQPGVGRGAQVSVRFKAMERAALARAAQAQGSSPANWLRSLALVHLTQRPQWNPAELAALRDLFQAIAAIDSKVTHIAQVVEGGVEAGAYPPEQGVAAREAVSLVQHEMRRVAAVMTGNFDYWGLPDAERPTAAPGAMQRAAAAVKAAEAQRKSRPTPRPAGFTQDK